MYLSLFS